MTNWEEVNVPKGAYLGWASKPGQAIIGKVVDYNENGGTNFAGEPCPSVAIELTEAAASFNKEGERTDFAAGELVQLNAGQVSLRRALRAADPKAGDLVKITLDNIVKTSSGGTLKEFGIKIARGAGVSAVPKAAAAVDDHIPPF